MRRCVPIVATFAVVFLAAGAGAAPDQAEDSDAEQHGGTHAAGHDESGHGEGEHAEGHHGLEPPPPINWTNFFGFKDKDAHGGELDAGEHSMAPPLLLALLNFAIFAGILYWKAAPPIRRFLANRHDTIKDALADAAELREQASDKLAEYTKKLDRLDKEIDSIKEQIRADAEVEKQRILDAAESQAAAIKRNADDRIAAEIARARLALEREVITAAVAAAEKLVREKATPADQSALVDSFIADLVPKAPPPGGGANVDEEWS